MHDILAKLAKNNKIESEVKIILLTNCKNVKLHYYNTIITIAYMRDSNNIMTMKM
jgi:hypothetical protein